MTFDCKMFFNRLVLRSGIIYPNSYKISRNAIIDAVKTYNKFKPDILIRCREVVWGLVYHLRFNNNGLYCDLECRYPHGIECNFDRVYPCISIAHFAKDRTKYKKHELVKEFDIDCIFLSTLNMDKEVKPLKNPESHFSMV